jgi:cytochrome c-type biogenesis protein
MELTVETIPSAAEAFQSGLMSFMSPCLLALLPVALTYVTGVALERRRGQAGGWRLKGFLLLHLAVFLGGFTTALVGQAVGHTWIGRTLLLAQGVLTVAGGLLVTGMGLFMTGLLPKMDGGDLRLRFRHTVWGAFASAVVGATYGLVWSPCMGPMLGTIFLTAGQPELSGQGVWLLLCHGAGFSIPFVLLSLVVDALLQMIRSPFFLLITEKTAGALLAILGLLIASGRFLFLTGWLFQKFSFWVDVLIQGGL